MAARVLIIQFPGVNCEYESLRAIESVDLKGEIRRWNDAAKAVKNAAAIILPGGWSYQDRIRAGVVAAKVKALDVVAAAAEAGKPVLGICNGAQVLVEAGLVPGVSPGHVEAALAENAAGWKGYYCAWVHVRVVKEGRETAFTSRFEEGEIVPMPVAHAQGRFTVRDRERFAEWMENGQVPLRYVTPDGGDDPPFPFNPNGSLFGAAGMTNPAGNVLAFMPHPERAARLRHVPDTLPGSWGDRRRDAFRRRELLDGPGPGFKIFQSLSDYLRWGRGREGRP